MKRVVLLMAVGVLAAGAAPSWLDAKAPANWNVAGAAIPAAPGPVDTELAPGGRCASVVRPTSTSEDKAVVAKGWSLIGPYERYGAASVLMATATADGMCRPDAFQGFVFVNDVFAGTLSPHVMNARADGSISGLSVEIYSSHEVAATFARYSDSDTLCCPHGSTSVTYEIKEIGGHSVVAPVSATTGKNP